MSVVKYSDHFLLLYLTGPPTVEFTSAVDRCVSLTVNWTANIEHVCGDVSYSVLLEDGMMSRTENTMDTAYIFTDLNENVSYSVNVTPSNMAGIGDPVILPPTVITTKKESMCLLICFFGGGGGRDAPIMPAKFLE